jgi:large conductance mechanosensitive channel
MFLNTLVDFLIVAFALFVLVKWINKARDMAERTAKPVPEVPAEPTTKECPYCLSLVPIKAVRCPHCTSHLTDN